MSISRQSPDASVRVRTFGVTLQPGEGARWHHAIPTRALDWHKLIYATRGVMTVRTNEGAWVVPSHRAAWIPAGVDYGVELSGVVALRVLYFRLRRTPFGGGARGSTSRGSTSAPSARASAAATCSVVNVTPLLRELILRAVQLGALDSSVAEQRRLTGVILDEVRALIAVPLQLPMPRDERAARFAELASAEPSGAGKAETRHIGRMLRKCGASRRTMERLFRAETSMSLGQWLRRRKLLDALRRLAAGESVNAIAFELGYNSPSAFIAMFRRELGQTPKRYFGAEEITHE
jgi:AraC-like DNA-binding protein